MKIPKPSFGPYVNGRIFTSAERKAASTELSTITCLADTAKSTAFGRPESKAKG